MKACTGWHLLPPLPISHLPLCVHVYSGVEAAIVFALPSLTSTCDRLDSFSSRLAFRSFSAFFLSSRKDSAASSASRCPSATLSWAASISFRFRSFSCDAKKAAFDIFSGRFACVRGTAGRNSKRPRMGDWGALVLSLAQPVIGLFTNLRASVRSSSL